MPGRILAIVTALAALVLGTPEATAAAHLEIIEPAGAVLDFGAVEVFGTSAPKRIRIANTGDDWPYFVDVSFGGRYHIVAQGGSLAPGDSRYWDLVFAPTPEDLWSGCSAFFDVDWTDAPWDGNDHLTTVFLDCVAAPGPYQSEAQWFGDVGVGDSQTLAVPVTNTSAVSRQITALSVGFGPFTAQLHGGSLPYTVAPGATFLVDVTFSPVAAPTSYITHVEILESGVRRFGFHVTGAGVAVQVVLSTSTLAFGDTYIHPSVPPMAEVQLTNVGAMSVSLPTATVTGPGFSLAASPPPGVLAPQASVTYRVAFAPDAAGAVTGTLSLGGLGQVALSGNGVLRPVSTAAALDFGDAFVGAVVRRSITLHNAGTSAFSVSSIQASDPRFRVVSADRAIPPLGDLVVELEYAPTAAGADAAQLAIALDGAPAPQLVVALRGAGVTLVPEVDPTPGPPETYSAPAGTGAPSAASPPDGGCSAHGGSASLAAALALALVPLRRRRRGRAEVVQ